MYSKGRSHIIHLLPRAHFLIRSSISASLPLSFLRWKTNLPPAYPFSRNSKAIEEWRKTLSNVPLKSPFAPVAPPSSTACETFFSAIEDHEKTRAHEPVMVDVTNGDKSMTYRELSKKTKSLAGFIKSRGFPVNGRASITMANSFEWAICQFGLWAAGLWWARVPSSLLTRWRDNSAILAAQWYLQVSLLQKVIEATKNCPDINTIICVRSSVSANSPLPEGIFDYNLATSYSPLLQFEKDIQASGLKGRLNVCTVALDDVLSSSQY